MMNIHTQSELLLKSRIFDLFEGLRKVWARLRGKPEPEPLDVSKMMPVTYLMAFLLLCTGALLIFADMVDPISLFDQLE